MSSTFTLTNSGSTVGIIRNFIETYKLKEEPVTIEMIDFLAENIKTKSGTGIGKGEARQYLKNNGVPESNLPRVSGGRGARKAASEAAAPVVPQGMSAEEAEKEKAKAAAKMKELREKAAAKKAQAAAEAGTQPSA